jgi:RNA polymerase sigma factor (sigma-70 family)
MTIETFEKDILPLKHSIFRFANFMLKNEDDAKDITQEVLIKIWEKRDEVYQVKNLRAWAITITRNKCLDLIKSKKGGAFSLDENIDTPTYDTPFDKMRINDETTWVKSLMEKLPVIQKEVFYLRHFEDDTYKEIGDSLNLDENKVKVYLHRARTFIKKELEAKHNYGLKTG